MLNPMPQGFYNHPSDSSLGFWWDGAGNMTEPFSKEALIAYRLAKGEPAPVFWPTNYPGNQAAAAEPAKAAEPPQWIKVSFPKNPSAPMLMRYYDGVQLSGYFDGRTVVDEVMMPEFYRQGGSKEWEANGYPDNCSDHDLFQMVWSRVTADQVKAVIGEEDTAPMYNNGATWIIDTGNPNLARWWDGEDFTGETEFIGVIYQRGFDEQTDAPEIVSHAPGLPGSEAGTWHIDPSDSTQLIRWGGQRWDRRKSLEANIAGLFEQLGEPVPELWSGVQHMSPRHAELIEQLDARKKGVNGWYKEPERFDDLHMRVWHEGQWIEQTSQQEPGFYDDPFNDEILRQWNGNAWTDKIVTKESERIRMEREELRRRNRAQFAADFMKGVSDHMAPDKVRQRKIDAAADQSRRLRDAASREAYEHHRGANDYWAQKAHDRRWK